MYEIEQLINLTGYSKNTIYTLSVSLKIKPVKGQVKGNPGKGVYSEVDLKKLLLYRELIENGITKDAAYAKVLSYRS